MCLCTGTSVVWIIISVHEYLATEEAPPFCPDLSPVSFHLARNCRGQHLVCQKEFSGVIKKGDWEGGEKEGGGGGESTNGQLR